MAALLSSKQNSTMFPSASAGGGLRRSLSQSKFAVARNSSANSSTASLSSMVGGLKRSGSSSRLMGSASAAHFGGGEHFAEPLAMASTSPDYTAGFSSSTSRRKAPSIDSESSLALSLDSDNDGSTDSDYAPAENPSFPSHYQQYRQYYSTDNLDGMGPKGSSYSGSPTMSYSPDRGNSETTSRPQSPIIMSAEDDTAVRAMPSRHVDYLSHEWREEDIWSSWKYVVSRRGEFSNSARLENASWRTWMKSKNKLKTISPETLNWLKESDVTWLYGPLQTGSSGDGIISSNDPPSAASTTKPILKKRTKSEAMLQRSLSASSLVMQATAAIEAQETHLRQARPILHKNHSAGFLLNDRRRLSVDNTPICPPSMLSSGVMSPSTEQRRIHFNEKVTQCIAIEERDDDNDEPVFNASLSDDDDDSVLTIRTRNRRVPLMRRKTAPVLKSAIKKTISMLPSTTLKREDDTPHSAAMKHTFHSPAVLPSSSREDNRASTTLRHSKKSGRFFASDDEDDEDDGIEIEQEEDISASNGKTFAPRKSGFASSLYDSDEEDEGDDDDDDGMQMAPTSRSAILGGMGLGDTRTGNFGSSSSLGSSDGGGLGGLKRSTSTSSLGDTGGMRRSSSGILRTSSGMLAGKGSFFSSASSGRRGF